MNSGERGNPLLRNLDRQIGIPLAFATGLLRRRIRKREIPASPQRIGILCLGGIGDLLLLSALTDGIRRLFPQASIELIGSAANAGALPLNPHADYSFYAPATAPLTLLRRIRARHYDIFLDSSQWPRLGAVLSNLSGARLTAGFRTKGQYRAVGYDRLCQHRSTCHELENFLGLGRALWPGFTGTPSLRLASSPPQDSAAIYCHMWPAQGPGRILKQWPEEHWRDLVSALVLAGHPVYLTGSGADRPDCEAFKKRFFARSESVRVIAGEDGLVGLAEKLAQAYAIISVNTGIMHLASLTGRPTIGLHGATNPLRWGPVGPNSASLLPRAGECAYLNLGHEYPARAKPAMANLLVEDVLKALARLTRQISRQARP